MELADDGCGVDPSQHQNVFKSFVQIENQQGTGLGLAVVSEIVRAMGGQISLRSQKSYGATFILDLPLTRAPWDGRRIPRVVLASPKMREYELDAMCCE